MTDAATKAAADARRRKAGIALAIAAYACFATQDTTTQAVSVSVTLLMGLWVRYAFQAVAT